MRKYIIINTSELDNLDYSLLETTSKESARKRLDGQKAIVSFEGSTPIGLENETQYTNAELLEILDDINNGWYLLDDE
mgnify:CR=1 FL=1